MTDCDWLIRMFVWGGAGGVVAFFGYGLGYVVGRGQR